MLAHKYERSRVPDPAGWWISEKLDGVRAYWDGANFWSRNGNQFPAPAWFKAGLPTDQALDGELWCARHEEDIHTRTPTPTHTHTHIHPIS